MHGSSRLRFDRSRQRRPRRPRTVAQLGAPFPLRVIASPHPRSAGDDCGWFVVGSEGDVFDVSISIMKWLRIAKADFLLHNWTRFVAPEYRMAVHIAANLL